MYPFPSPLLLHPFITLSFPFGSFKSFDLFLFILLPPVFLSSPTRPFLPTPASHFPVVRQTLGPAPPPEVLKRPQTQKAT